MTKALAKGYIDEELEQLGTDYVDLLLFHHRCKTAAETANVWKAFEEAKRSGKAKHIGVSNFNVHDLQTLQQTAELPIEVLEAHFGIGLMDFEVLAFAKQHNIHVAGFASTSEDRTDHPTFHPAVSQVARSHGLSSVQVMYAYLNNWNVTFLSSCFHRDDPWKCMNYFGKDLEVFNHRLSADEMRALDAVTAGKRTCTDCFTDECQACAHALQRAGCPLEARVQTEGFPVWGRSNMRGMRCLECAKQHEAALQEACGGTTNGETLETMIPKACGI